MPSLNTISKNVGKVLGLTAKAIKNNKKLLISGGIGVGIGASAVKLMDDGHDKSDHGRKKIAELEKEAITEKFIDPRHLKRLKDLNLLAVKSPLLYFKKSLKNKDFKELLDKTTKQTFGLPKTAEDMTPKEKADQKYAISKSYENEGHPRKADEYKNKASKAYKRAWEIKNK